MRSRAVLRWCIPLIVGLMVGAGSLAIAAIPDSGGTVHGCYVTKTGKLKVIDTEASGKCAATETALTWNQKGVTGATGATGPTGATGSAGENGVSGLQVLEDIYEVPWTGGELVRGPSGFPDETGRRWFTRTVICPTGKKAISGGYEVVFNNEHGSTRILTPIAVQDHAYEEDTRWAFGFVLSPSDLSEEEQRDNGKVVLIDFLTCIDAS